MAVWHLNVGELSAKDEEKWGGNRSWEDSRELGFISAGQEPKFSKPLKKIEPGDSVYAYLSRHGYVGFGRVVSKAEMVRDVRVEGRPLLEQARRNSFLERNADDPERCEYVVRIQWLKALDRNSAVRTPDGKASPQVVHRLSGDKLSFLKAEFSPHSDQREPTERGKELLVGARRRSAESQEVQAREAEKLRESGRLAFWWSYPLGEKEAVLQEWPYLYTYIGGSQKQLTHRYGILDYRSATGNEGSESPWPKYTLEGYRGKRRAGEKQSEIFKTWFLVGEIEELKPAIELDELESSDGSAANPSALLNSFGVWRLKSPKKGALRWSRSKPDSYDLLLANPDQLDVGLVRELIDQVGYVDSGRQLSKAARDAFDQWLTDLSRPLGSDAYLSLQNWFMGSTSGEYPDGHKGVKTDKAAWDALFQVRPPERLTKSEAGKNLQVIPDRYERWWRLMEEAQSMNKFQRICESLWVEEKLFFPEELVSNYLLALQTKRFVILTGLSGTGKTKLALAIARCFQEQEDHYEVVAVRPDWTDNRGLLGYYNPLTNRYSDTPLLRLLLKAEKDRSNPYFVILDEMNLAKVEHYFSDFLSCLESGEQLHLHDDPHVAEAADPIPRKLAIPRNVFFTGTVNVDETTYMFSPKVLDRAFTLELSEVNLSALDQRPESDLVCSLPNLPGALTISRLSPEDWKKFGDLFHGELRSLVEQFHALLATENCHFGYRVALEIARYVLMAYEQSGQSKDACLAFLDLAILQKILPKFHGTQAELEEILATIYNFAVSDKSDATFIEIVDSEDWNDGGGRLRETARLPRTAYKVRRMLQRLRQRGFTSFIE